MEGTSARPRRFDDVSSVRHAIGRSVTDINNQHLANSLQRLPKLKNLKHPSYSPEMNPCDFVAFRSLRNLSEAADFMALHHHTSTFNTLQMVSIDHPI
ncbi:hypothetical protein TNCV_643921 [Trichonephila clavipes]|nr:hypothetical protein TNCV_643921 [Trichonephila clavipes]